ncbi:uncharacterized protein KRP23_2129 [Phytophthora ramorum]|uniref:uncharacterized protein n=1 Tax=Phytophthora ramorum TaxID=164328 RepID=UPI003098D864|nr:hypothetical protein KRP23_2129 [Phytophthora ramorum]
MEAQGRKGTALFLGQNQKKKGLIIQVEARRDKTRQCVVQLAHGDSDPASIFTLTSPALECVCRYLHLQTGSCGSSQSSCCPSVFEVLHTKLE